MKNDAVMSKDEVQDLIKKFSIAYDIVRVVDPEKKEVLSFDGTDYKETRFEPCFAVWEKDKRCDNCISIKACMDKKRMSKFEFRNEEAYSVLSVPILIGEQGHEHMAALELVNHVTEETTFQAKGNTALEKHVQRLNQRMYEDSLTGVYNRRYYDEDRYIMDLSESLPKQICYVIIDINRFKYVNDHFGHSCGDELLVAVAAALQKNVRQSDRLMRIGGDEFLLVLRDCSRLFAEKKILQLKEAVSLISKKWMGEYTPSISVGMSYADQFDGTRKCLEMLFHEADERMYDDKSMPVQKKKSMLIVDDLEVNREVLKHYFLQDFDIYEAENGREALRVLKSNIIEVVITDIYMPEMDGLTLTREIRRDPELASVIVFVVTERGEKHEIGALEAGADDFINKPFNPELLSHRMRGVLSQNTVFNRISQYQLSFNQNQIAFATIRLEQGCVVFQYVNDAFAQMMDGTPQEFISGRKGLHFKGFTEFLKDVSTSYQRNTMTVHDETTNQYYDIVAYAQDNGFCSFIVLKNLLRKVNSFLAGF